MTAHGMLFDTCHFFKTGGAKVFFTRHLFLTPRACQSVIIPNPMILGSAQMERSKSRDSGSGSDTRANRKVLASER